MTSREEKAALLAKAIGDNDAAQAVTAFIDTGYPPLNAAICGDYDGGLPYGRLVEMYGESSTGKTLLATRWMIEAQRLGGVAIFIDWERSFDADMAEELGLSLERPEWVYARPKTWEAGNTFAAKACDAIRKNKLIDPSAPVLVVFDSIAASVPNSTVDKALDELSMNDSSALSRVTSTTLKTMASLAADYNATFLYLNQVREKIGVVYGDKTSTPGGKAMGFSATVRLSLTRQKLMEVVEGEKEMVGQLINITVTKSKLTRPNKKASLIAAFEDDGRVSFDLEASLLDYLIAEGKVATAGARVNWIDGKSYYKKQLLEKLRADTEGYATLKSLLADPTTSGAAPSAEAA